MHCAGQSWPLALIVFAAIESFGVHDRQKGCVLVFLLFCLLAIVSSRIMFNLTMMW